MVGEDTAYPTASLCSDGRRRAGDGNEGGFKLPGDEGAVDGRRSWRFGEVPSVTGELLVKTGDVCFVPLSDEITSSASSRSTLFAGGSGGRGGAASSNACRRLSFVLGLEYEDDLDEAFERVVRSG